MPSFNYVSVDDNGFEVTGVLAAESEDQLASQLRRQGQYLVRTSAASEGGSLSDIRVLERINHTMTPHGLLFVGHSENFSESRDLFRLRGKTIYERV